MHGHGHAGACRRDACRPEGLEQQYGMHDGKYYLSPAQAQAILELRLHRLTGLEHEKLLNEYQEMLRQNCASCSKFSAIPSA